MTTNLISTSPKRKWFVRLRNYCIIFLGILITQFKSRNLSGPSNGKIFLGENYALIGLTLLLTTIILGFTFHFLSRKKKQIGKITMTKETITIELADNTFNFKVNETKDIKIKQGFFDVTKEAVTFLSSYDNWLTFEYNNLKYKYQFTIGSSYSSNQLKELLTIWGNNLNSFAVEEIK